MTARGATDDDVERGPSDDELRKIVGRRLGTVESLRRERFDYATSAPIERVIVTTERGESCRLILKHLDPDRRIGDAKRKPPRLHRSDREPLVYRHLLHPAHLGADWYASELLPVPWVLIEEVVGVPLWQSDDLDDWRRAASWLARWHRRRPPSPSEHLPLLCWDGALVEATIDAAKNSLSTRSDPRARMLSQALDQADDLIERFVAMESTLLHGEAFASNFIVTTDAVTPIDWELASIGPAFVDVAALTTGWAGRDRSELIDAYARVAGRPVDRVDLARCRLHVALVYLGWSRGWIAPVEHRTDWVGEALSAIGDLV